MPRVYLTTPYEVSKQLKLTAKGRGDSILYENHTWKTKRAFGYGTTEQIPEEWIFSKERIEQLLEIHNRQ